MVPLAIVAQVIGSVALLTYCVDTEFTLWSIAASILYSILFKVMHVWLGNETIEGYPKVAYYVSLLSQCVVLPSITCGLVWKHRHDFEGWLYGPHGAPERDPWRMAVFSSIAGAMMKDFWIYGDINEWFMVIHHFFSLYACCFVSNATVFQGHIALNGLQAECLSFIYNVRVLWPSNTSRAIHCIVMTLSNFCGIICTYLYCTEVEDDALLYRKALYCLISTALVAVRFAGANESLQDIRKGPGSPTWGRASRAPSPLKKTTISRR